MHPPLIGLAGLLPVFLVFPGCDPTPPPTPATTTERPTSAAPTSVAPSAPAPETPSPSPTPTTPAADTHFYGNFTTYPAPAKTDDTTPGAGYRVVFSQNISRHGSRSISSATDTKDALELWQQASDANALTSRGQQFAPAVRKLDAAMKKVGYGELSTLGEQELHAMGEREGDRLETYFAAAAKAKASVEVINTGVHRTETSADNFLTGLEKTQPDLTVADQETEPGLHFGSGDADNGTTKDEDKRLRAAYEKATADNDLEAAAMKTLRLLYSKKFVATISDPEPEGKAIWDLYRAQAAMSKDVDVDLTPFIDPDTAAAFSFDQDADWYYSRGPGIAGTDLSYEAADPLLDDFFAAADDRLSGGSTAAVYRFAHDTEIAPFAARLELPGSTQLKSAKAVYSWDDSDFRVARVTPLAANIEWTLWRNEAGKVLVQVRRNEIPTTLGRSCQVTVKTGSFYDWDEAKRCLGAG